MLSYTNILSVMTSLSKPILPLFRRYFLPAIPYQRFNDDCDLIACIHQSDFPFGGRSAAIISAHRDSSHGPLIPECFADSLSRDPDSKNSSGLYR